MTKPKKINVRYIASSRTAKKSDDDDVIVEDAVKQKLSESDGQDCPFC